MEKKLRHSHQRDMIYNYLLCSKEHPSADKIYEDLRAEMPNLSLGTVYRNLKLLEETGKIRRVTTLQNVERYDACCGEHAHFICEKCGCVKDLPMPEIPESGMARVAAEGDCINWLNVTLGGICAACANKEAN